VRGADLIEDLSAHTDPRVMDAPDVVAFRRDLRVDMDGAASGSGIDRVRDQIEQRLAELGLGREYATTAPIEDAAHVGRLGRIAEALADRIEEALDLDVAGSISRLVEIGVQKIADSVRSSSKTLHPLATLLGELWRHQRRHCEDDG